MDKSLALDLLRLVRMRPTIFGCEGHGFVLHEPLSEAFVEAFEARHGIRLPADYRWFITTIANGGAGPGYGLFRLGEYDDGAWNEGDGFVGALAKPFPYAAPWNDLAGRPPVELMEKDEAAYMTALNEFDARYFAPVDGAIPVCHMGCAIRIWLVVSGPEAGNLWQDDRANDGGWEPLGSPRLRFLEWYQSWLHAALSEGE